MMVSRERQCMMLIECDATRQSVQHKMHQTTATGIGACTLLEYMRPKQQYQELLCILRSPAHRCCQQLFTHSADT